MKLTSLTGPRLKTPSKPLPWPLLLLQRLLRLHKEGEDLQHEVHRRLFDGLEEDCGHMREELVPAAGVALLRRRRLDGVREVVTDVILAPSAPHRRRDAREDADVELDHKRRCVSARRACC